MTNQTKYKFRIIQYEGSKHFVPQLSQDGLIWSDIWTCDTIKEAEEYIEAVKEHEKPKTFQVVKEAK